MNYQMTIWKVGICLLLSLPFLSQPIYASEATASTAVEEIAVRSDNPIMIIRCRSSIAEEFVSNRSKKIGNAKEWSGPCGFGFNFNEITGECVPNCNQLRESPFGYTYDSETGLCDCNPPIEEFKGNTSKEEHSECLSFCFYSELMDLDDEDCQILVCLPLPFDDDESPGPVITYFDEEFQGCVPACFDGELNVDVPEIDCGNSGDLVAITVCFTSADPDNPLIPGQMVPFADIQNCFGDEGEPLLQAAIDANNGNNPTQGEEYFFQELVGEDGKLCVDFFINPEDPLVINFTNAGTVTVPTCYSFEDPCSCANPNILNNDGDVELFYDELTNSNDGSFGVDRTIRLNTNNSGFRDASGAEITAGTNLGMTDDMGNFRFPFYRESGEVVDISLDIFDVNDMPVLGGSNIPFTNDEACISTNCAIPTISQWGLMILALLLSSLGLAFLTKRKLA